MVIPTQEPKPEASGIETPPSPPTSSLPGRWGGRVVKAGQAALRLVNAVTSAVRAVITGDYSRINFGKLKPTAPAPLEIASPPPSGLELLQETIRWFCDSCNDIETLEDYEGEYRASLETLERALTSDASSRPVDSQERETYEDLATSTRTFLNAKQPGEPINKMKSSEFLAEKERLASKLNAHVKEVEVALSHYDLKKVQGQDLPAVDRREKLSQRVRFAEQIQISGEKQRLPLGPGESVRVRLGEQYHAPRSTKPAYGQLDWIGKNVVKQQIEAKVGIGAYLEAEQVGLLFAEIAKQVLDEVAEGKIAPLAAKEQLIKRIILAIRADRGTTRDLQSVAEVTEDKVGGQLVSQERQKAVLEVCERVANEMMDPFAATVNVRQVNLDELVQSGAITPSERDEYQALQRAQDAYYLSLPEGGAARLIGSDCYLDNFVPKFAAIQGISQAEVIRGVIHQAQSTHPVVSEEWVKRAEAFITKKAKEGTPIERQIYNPGGRRMTVEAFIDRCLTKRPVMYDSLSGDHLLSLKYDQKRDPNGFDTIGGERDVASRTYSLANFLSFDERELAAGISLASETYAFSSGATGISAAISENPSTHLREMVQVASGSAGDELPRPDTETFVTDVVTKEQNTLEHGYGWNIVEGKEHLANLPTYDELAGAFASLASFGKDSLTARQKLLVESYLVLDKTDKQGNRLLLHPRILQQRALDIARSHLAEAAAVGTAERPTFVNVTGANMAVWVPREEQEKFLVEAYVQVLKENPALAQNIGALNFSGFTSIPVTDSKIEFVKRDPASPLPEDRQNWVVVNRFGSNSQAAVGNKAVMGDTSSVDSAAAHSTLVMLLMNPQINRHVRGKNQQVVGVDGKLLSRPPAQPTQDELQARATQAQALAEVEELERELAKLSEIAVSAAGRVEKISSKAPITRPNIPLSERAEASITAAASFDALGFGDGDREFSGRSEEFVQRNEAGEVTGFNFKPDEEHFSDDTKFSGFMAAALNDPLSQLAYAGYKRGELPLSQFVLTLRAVAIEKQLTLFSDKEPRAYGVNTMKELKKLREYLETKDRFFKATDHDAQLKEATGEDKERLLRLSEINEYIRTQSEFGFAKAGCGGAMMAHALGIALKDDPEALLAASLNIATIYANHPTGAIGTLLQANFVAWEAEGIPHEEWGNKVLELEQQIKQYFTAAPEFKVPAKPGAKQTLGEACLEQMAFTMLTQKHVLADLGLIERAVDQATGEVTFAKKENPTIRLAWDRDYPTYRSTTGEDQKGQKFTRVRLGVTKLETPEELMRFGQAIAWKSSATPGASGHDLPILAFVGLLMVDQRIRNGKTVPEAVVDVADSLIFMKGKADRDSIGVAWGALVGTRYGNKAVLSQYVPQAPGEATRLSAFKADFVSLAVSQEDLEAAKNFLEPRRDLDPAIHQAILDIETASDADRKEALDSAKKVANKFIEQHYPAIAEEARSPIALGKWNEVEKLIWE